MIYKYVKMDSLKVYNEGKPTKEVFKNYRRV